MQLIVARYTGVFMRIIQSDKYANQGDDIFLSLYMYAKKKKKKKKYGLMHLARFIESRDSVINTTKKITSPCNRLSRHLPRLNELTVEERT